jgi:hypothetical protein
MYIKYTFWYNADWAAYYCCARHPVKNIINYIFLKPHRLRTKLVTQRQKQGGNNYFSI